MKDIETHGPVVTNLVPGFVMLSPLIGLIFGFLGAWLVGAQ